MKEKWYNFLRKMKFWFEQVQTKIFACQANAKYGIMYYQPISSMNNTIKQALHYIVHNAGDGVMTQLYLLKTIYLADRYHLRKYGRTITGDEYCAYNYGPIATHVRDSIKADIRLDANFTDAFVPLEPNSTKTPFKSVSEPCRESLSDSEIEALQVALSTFRKVGPNAIVEYTHQFPEWKNCELALRNAHCIDMNLEDFFDPVDEKIEYCPASPELVALNREFYRNRI